jgi:hypothetical protein
MVKMIRKSTSFIDLVSASWGVYTTMAFKEVVWIVFTGIEMGRASLR